MLYTLVAPPSVENTLDEAMILWAHEGRSWTVIENALADLKLGGIDQALQSVDIVPEQIRSLIPKLKAGPEGKSIRLPEGNPRVRRSFQRKPRRFEECALRRR